MPATFSTAIDLIAVIDFARLHHQPAPPPGAREYVRPKRGRGKNCRVPSTAEIERLTRLVVDEMVRAVRWRRGPDIGHLPPKGG